MPRPAGVKATSSDLTNLKDKPSEQQEYVDQDQGKLTRDFTTVDWLRYRSRYGELVELADRSLGMVLGAVKDWDQQRDRLPTDHGDVIGEHGLPFKGPFMYEPLIRIPFVISAPWKSRAGVRDDMTVQIDLAPTLASLAGVQWPGKPTGRDLTKGPTGARMPVRSSNTMPSRNG